MTSIATSIILDGVMVLLLIATIVYCWQLNRRIKLLQDSKGELAQLIRKFDASTERASASIVELQMVSKRVSSNIKTKLEKANFIADDLAFMIEKGNKLADKMGTGIASGGRNAPRDDIRTSAMNKGVREIPVEPSRAVQDIKRDLPQPARRTVTERGDMAKKAASLASVLEKVSERKAQPGEPTGAPRQEMTPRRAEGRGAPTVRLRTKAERELMDALKSGS